jgi:hypothetical protein
LKERAAARLDALLRDDSENWGQPGEKDNVPTLLKTS